MPSRYTRWTLLLFLASISHLPAPTNASIFAAPPAHHAIYSHLRSLEGLHDAQLKNRATTDTNEEMDALAADLTQLNFVMAGLTPEIPALKGVRNSLGWGQDPSAYSRLEKDGKVHYYFVTNDFDRRIFILSGTNINDIFSDPASEKEIFKYEKAVGTEAPAIYHWSKYRFLLYVSSVGPEGDGVMRVLASKSDDLLGEWEDLGEMKNAGGGSLVNYDGHAFTHPNGKRYFMYSALRSVEMAELLSETQIGPAIKLADGDGIKTIEAPTTWIQDGMLNFIWSENPFNEPSYNTLNRAISTDLDPLDPQSWAGKPNTTILQSGNGIYGPGSSCVFEGPGGPWIAYGAFSNPLGFPLTKNPRKVQAQPATIRNGVIQPMLPVKATRYLDEPI